MKEWTWRRNNFSLIISIKYYQMKWHTKHSYNLSYWCLMQVNLTCLSLWKRVISILIVPFFHFCLVVLCIYASFCLTFAVASQLFNVSNRKFKIFHWLIRKFPLSVIQMYYVTLWRINLEVTIQIICSYQ